MSSTLSNSLSTKNSPLDGTRLLARSLRSIDHRPPQQCHSFQPLIKIYVLSLERWTRRKSIEGRESAFHPASKRPGGERVPPPKINIVYVVGDAFDRNDGKSRYTRQKHLHRLRFTSPSPPTSAKFPASEFSNISIQARQVAVYTRWSNICRTRYDQEGSVYSELLIWIIYFRSNIRDCMLYTVVSHSKRYNDTSYAHSNTPSLYFWPVKRL